MNRMPPAAIGDLSLPVLPSTAAGRDWHRIFEEIKQKLQLIIQHPFVAEDERCNELLLAMASVNTTPDLAPIVDEFAQRIVVLLEERGAEGASELRATLTRRSSTRKPSFAVGATSDETSRSNGSGRTRLRL